MKKYVSTIVAILALAVAAPAFAANADNPDGCKPYGLFGQFSASFGAFEAAASQTIVEGDPVKFDGSRQIVIAGATDSQILGFARTAVTSSSAGDLIYVYNDPNAVYQCQCSGTFAITMIGTDVDLEGTTGIFEVNENATTYKPVKIVGYNHSDSVGANTRVLVTLNMSSLGHGGTGVHDDLAILDDLVIGDDVTIGGTLGVTGAVTGGSFTDGTATLDGSGNLTGVANLGATGDFTLGGHKLSQALFMGSFDYPEEDGSEWWGVAGAAALPASITAKACYINLTGIKAGAEILSYSIIGKSIEGAALTLDATLVEVALDGTESDPTGDGTNAITQIDSGLSFTAVAAFSAPYTVLANKAYRIKLLGTTAGGDSIVVQGANVVVNRK